ncbi:unnamed protein product [Spirodela intermedia]|uniref:C2H2-type domain-containing protein n=1 Tax=Spirodela intermedia TaxID=51605 RepID=A0A7I8JMU5_SPIIN|nr:unnamed protein product [Spirodela intermedia]CAA6671135.1 unnamed protein product [Spirodela intermedia]
MADVMDMPVEAMDRRRDRQPDKRERTQPEESPPPPPARRREKDFTRDRREDRDVDRPANRRDDYHDSRNRSLGGQGVPQEEQPQSSGVPRPPSLSTRRSPPPGQFKRSRRDDGGYDKRRGSPRGGFDERRLSYDYVGGYDRGGPGGRPGYADERMHARYRTSEWSESGRASLRDGGQREGLMSYKQFIQELEDDILPAEAERRYEEYRSEYIATQKRAFFEAHKDEDWLKDKYHPTSLVTVIERRNENARTVAKELLLDLHSGTLDIGPGLTASSLNKSGHGSDPNSEDEVDAGGKRRRHGRGPAKESDLVSSAPKAHPVSSEPRRIQSDVELAQSLIRKLDAEKGIEENVLSTSNSDNLEGERSRAGSTGPIIIIRGLTAFKGLEGVELLDTLITYLWRVHGVDYYGMTETNEAKGLRHVRVDVKNYDATNPAAAEWEKKLETFWRGRLSGNDPLETRTAKEKIDAAGAEALDPFVRKIRDEKYGWKYGCGAKGCTKLFHGAEFVHKHLKLKHPELVLELTSKVREDLYFQNYMSDPNAPGGTPIMQQPAPRDRGQRTRPERGPRRDHDRVERGADEDRFERGENSPPADFQARNGGAPEGMNPDEPLFDAFGAQGLHGGPFPSDIPPPPVLMPVPGAGPLGPFVPAPPEVAMRMLREQGGAPPPPFDGNGGPGGGSARSSLFSLALAASYQDLDAPEDEVTVIDYRSL